MFKIAENGIVTLNAGDSFKVPLYVFFNDESQQYELQEFNTIYFSLMEPQDSFNHGVIRKIYTYKDFSHDGGVYIEFKPEDTEDLHPGVYYYEVKLQEIKDNKEYITTIIPKRKFYIL